MLSLSRLNLVAKSRFIDRTIAGRGSGVLKLKTIIELEVIVVRHAELATGMSASCDLLEMDFQRRISKTCFVCRISNRLAFAYPVCIPCYVSYKIKTIHIL